jgi:transcriptional regulator with XRE-family HTH domain
MNLIMKYGISERIRIFRVYKSLKQSVFAELIGVSRSTLSEVENGKNKNPSTSVIVNIVDAFNDINIEWLLIGKGEMIKADAEDTHSVNIMQIMELIEVMNNKQKHEILEYIIEKKRIYELENLVMQLTEQNNQ